MPETPTATYVPRRAARGVQEGKVRRGGEALHRSEARKYRSHRHPVLEHRLIVRCHKPEAADTCVCVQVAWQRRQASAERAGARIKWAAQRLGLPETGSTSVSRHVPWTALYL